MEVDLLRWKGCHALGSKRSKHSLHLIQDPDVVPSIDGSLTVCLFLLEHLSVTVSALSLHCL